MCYTKFEFDFLTLISTKEEPPRLISSCKIPIQIIVNIVPLQVMSFKFQ